VKAYLDNASTTPLSPEALSAMLPFLTEHYGNPSAPNAPGRRARLALDEARDQIAECLGCLPGEVVFCSGGTEAANLAIFGADAAAGPGQMTSVCSAFEHHAVLRAVESIGGTTVSVNARGVIDLEALESELGGADNAGRNGQVGLVAVMLANNEVGTVQPIGEVTRLVREHAPGAVLVVDAVHAAPWLDIAALCTDAEMFFVSAHKFGGPKGVGALVVRSGTLWTATGRGGAQERERRPGTENVAAIVGMAAALGCAVRDRQANVFRVSALRDRLADGICSSSRAITETAVQDGDRSEKVAGTCHVTVEGVEQDELLFLLDREGIYASAGSACASGAAEPNHVLEAMGIELTSSKAAALRLSLGATTTDDEVDYAVHVIPKIVEHLRSAG
jgi:cysteine desulfurase